MTFFWRRNVRVRRSTIPGTNRGVRGGRPGFSPRAQQSGGWHPNGRSSQGAARRLIRADRSGARANRCWTGSWTRGRGTPPELLNKGMRHTTWTTEQEDEAHHLNYWTKGRDTPPELPNKRTRHNLNYWTRGRGTPPERLNKGTRHTTWTTEQEGEIHHLNYWTRGWDTPTELLNKTTRHTAWTIEQEDEVHHLNYRTRGRVTPPGLWTRGRSTPSELPNKRTRHTTWTAEQEVKTHHLKYWRTQCKGLSVATAEELVI